MPEGGLIKIQACNVDLETERRKITLPLQAGKYIKISVEDQGIGIPKEHLSKIFDPYFTTKQKGSGLGLATTYSVIKNHNGLITVKSELRIGTTFAIYLPATDKKIEKIEIKKDEKIISGKGKVLVMDDEMILLEFVSEMLKHIGYESESAQNGAEAIELYKNAKENGRPFDVVIMDLTIPGGMGGKEAIKRLKEIDPSIKAIVSSGYSNDPVMANYRDYGFVGVLPKPYRLDDLVEVLKNFINE
jgi:CheY-like chemotaxis protein